MRITQIIFRAITLGVIFVSCAMAEPREGSKLIYAVQDNKQGNWVWSGVVKDGELRLGEGQKFGRRSRSLYPSCFLHCNRSSHPVEISKLRSLFPLKKGKQVKFIRRRADGSRSWLHTTRVAGAKDFESKYLGEMKVVVFESTIVGQKGLNFRGRTTTYWSPELELVVYERNTGGSWVNEIYLQDIK